MDDGTCPLCTEELDPTDCLLASRLCQCRFSVCLWCFRRITEDAAKDSRPALCPNCREPYDVERITREGRELNPEQLEEVKRKKGRPEEKRKPAPANRPRKDLANVRVVQRNLVYVVGLPMDVCYEEVLSSSEYIGQFGKIVKISVSRSGPYGSLAAKNGPTGSAYITFKRIEDARRCIESIHGTTWEGKLVKACYGTTKYCNAFLKGLPCNNAECLYLHDVAAEEDSYTKEETKSTRFVNLVHAASLNQASAVANGQVHSAPSGEPLGPPPAAAQQVLEQGQRLGSHDPEPPSSVDEEQMDGAGWPSLGGTAWASKAAAAAATQAMPPTGDSQAWPGLPGAGGSSSAEVSEAEGEPKPPLARNSMSMADKLARGSPAATAKAQDPAPKKLTPLAARGKPAAEQVSETAGANGRDRLSPPRTPQPVQKPPQQQESSVVARAVHSVSVESGKAVHGSCDSHSSATSKPPPGFDAAAKPKAVPPPPGFVHAVASSEHGSVFASPHMPYTAEAASRSASLQAIWGSSLDTGFARPLNGVGVPPGYDQPLQPQPRARSRFHFANDDEPPAPAQAPLLGSLSSGSLGGYGGACGVPPAPFAGMPEWKQPNGVSAIPSPAVEAAGNGNGDQSLPAGLLLLRKLQAQGGVVRSRSGNSNGESSHLQHAIFQDPAVLSARPSTDQAASQRSWLDDFGTARAEGGSETARTEGQAAPKTPPRRRKGKASS